MRFVVRRSAVMRAQWRTHALRQTACTHQQFGIVPLNAFIATEMVLAVLSSRSCTGNVPRSDMLNSTRSPTPPMDVGDTPKFIATVSWHATPVHARPNAREVLAWPTLLLPRLFHGAHGCRCVLPQLAASVEVL